MTDVFKLLRRFREETPPPSTDAWTRARASIAAAASEERRTQTSLAQRTNGSKIEWGRSLRLGEGQRNPWRNHKRRTIIAGLASAALIAGVLVAVLTSPGGLTAPVHTKWQAARALPVSRTNLHAPKGTWLLADFITSEGWQQNTTGPEPGNLACPTAQICFVTGDNSNSSSGEAIYNSLYVSYDGALSWNVLPIPSGVDFSTPLTCAGANNCAAGATDNGQPVFITTTDGGHSFTIDPLPSTYGQLYSLSCPSLTFCAGLAATSADPNNDPIDATFLSTNNGGTSFIDSPIVAGESMASLACPTTTDCVAVGASESIAANNPTTGVVAQTTDAGASWTSGALPGGFGIYYLSRLTCADATHCSVLGIIRITNANPPACSTIVPIPSSSEPSTTTTSSTTTTNIPVSPELRSIEQQESAYALAQSLKPGDYSCTSGNTLLISDIASTSDGGLTWTPEALPSNAPQPQLSDIACANFEHCVASGTAAIPQEVGPGQSNGGSAIVLVTNNAGTTWSTVTFAVPSNIPSGMQLDALMAVGDIQCPQVNDCMALGVSDQGSKSTPVYTSGSSSFAPASPTQPT